MTSEEVRARLRTDPDFVYLPRFENSLSKLLDRYPDGVPDKLIAQALLITDEEVEVLFQTILRKLRRAMGVDAA